MAENERGSGRQREWKLKKGLDAFGNIFGINICFVIGCLPVITVGASLAAAYATCIRLQENEEETVLSCYIREFKRNFKQATLGWLALLVIVAVLLAEWILINTQTGALSLFYTIVFYLELLFTVLALTYFFPLIARFNTTVKQAAKNSILLSVGYFFSCIKIVTAWVAPIAFSIIYPIIFLYSWYLWLLIIFGAIMWGTSHTIRFVFKQNQEAIEQSAEEAVEEAKKRAEERQQLEDGRKLLKDAEKSRREKAAEASEAAEKASEEATKEAPDETPEETLSEASSAGNAAAKNKTAKTEGASKAPKKGTSSEKKAEPSKEGKQRTGQSGNKGGGQNRNNQNNQKKKQQNRYYPAANKTKNKKK